MLGEGTEMTVGELENSSESENLSPVCLPICGPFAGSPILTPICEQCAIISNPNQITPGQQQRQMYSCKNSHASTNLGERRGDRPSGSFECNGEVGRCCLPEDQDRPDEEGPRDKKAAMSYRLFRHLYSTRT